MKTQKRVHLTISHLSRVLSRKIQYALSLLLSDAARPLRFIIIGGIAGLVQLLLLSLFIKQGWQLVLANAVAYVLSAQVNFILSTFFTWHDRQSNEANMRGKKTMRARWLTFHGSIIGTGLLNMLVFVLAKTVMPSLLASALGIAGASITNFFLFNRFVFRNVSYSEQQPPEGSTARLRL